MQPHCRQHPTLGRTCKVRSCFPYQGHLPATPSSILFICSHMVQCLQDTMCRKHRFWERPMPPRSQYIYIYILQLYCWDWISHPLVDPNLFQLLGFPQTHTLWNLGSTTYVAGPAGNIPRLNSGIGGPRLDVCHDETRSWVADSCNI